MATQPSFEHAMTVEEYLSTVFEHDCELVDGEVVERAMGEFEHSFLQGILVTIFNTHRVKWGLICLPEQRVNTRPGRYRVPDLVILKSDAPRERVLTHPPMLIIEILSPEDTLRRATQKVIEYCEFGVENVWVIDPSARVAYLGSKTGIELTHTRMLTINGTPIQINLDELFAELDKI